MNSRTPSLPEQLRAAAYSRRSLLKSLGASAGLVGATRLPRWTAAQTAPSNAEIDALYHSAAAMPHLFAEFAFPFVRRAWEMNGRGTLVYSLDTALAASAITPQDAELLGAPDALYFASIIKPAGESWSDSRYLTIANYPSPDEAAAAAGRFVAAGAPAGASDLTANLDPSLGQALSYALTVDLSGTPAEQVFSIFAAGNWLFRYYALTPQLAAAAVPYAMNRQSLRSFPLHAPEHDEWFGLPAVDRAMRVSAIPLVAGEEVASESAAIVATALTFSGPASIRALLNDKGYADEEINAFVNDLFPSRFSTSVATRIDYPKHNLRDYDQYAGIDANNEMQHAYYAEAMCVVADDAPIPPSNTHYAYGVKRFFASAADASAFFDAMPTPAQQATHTANGVTFQDDPDASAAGKKASYIAWKPPEATSTLPGYGVTLLRGPVVSHLNVYLVQPPPDGPTAIDPANPLFQSLRAGVMEIVDQQQQFDASPTSWPIYETPASFAG